MVIALALLTLAIGLCLFDQDDHDAVGHAGLVDLCLGMLAVSLGVVPLRRILTVGSVLDTAAVAVHIVPRNTPDPPPRLALFR